MFKMALSFECAKQSKNPERYLLDIIMPPSQFSPTIHSRIFLINMYLFYKEILFISGKKFELQAYFEFEIYETKKS